MKFQEQRIIFSSVFIDVVFMIVLLTV